MINRDRLSIADSIRTWLLWLGLSSLFALAQFRLIVWLYGANFRDCMQASAGVVDGLPHWVVYQSRVLAPYTIYLLYLFNGDYFLAHRYFTEFFIGISGILILFTARKRYGADAAGCSFFLFQTLFSLILRRPWIYSWDIYNIIFFTVFNYFVFSGKSWRWFCCLFALAIFNRESALFFALWMILDPLIKRYPEPQRENIRFNWQMFSSGVACLILGVAALKILRDKLLIRELGPELFNLTGSDGRQVQIHLLENLKYFRDGILHPDIPLDFLYPLLTFITLLLAVKLAMRDYRRYLAFATMVFVEFLTLWVVGLISEARVMLELTPFLAIAIWELRLARNPNGRLDIFQLSSEQQLN